jgi:hypothetical protein
MVLLGDEAQVEARFGLFRDSANLGTRQVNGLLQMYRRLRNLFGCTDGTPTLLGSCRISFQSVWRCC